MKVANSRTSHLIFILVWLLPFIGQGEDAPLTIDQSLKLFQIEKGARIEIAAAEPQLRDPVAMCFDAKGRMLVVEALGYPFLPGEGKEAPKLGSIALLEDENGDGRFEKRTTFADGFTFPNGILPWKGGVFVTCAPDIWYLKDTTGDGRADVRHVVLTGFGTKSSSEQLRVASPTLGPDAWVYVTSGLTDANVTSPLYPDRKPVLSKRQDCRFHPETFVYEPLAGVGQFGQCFDAAGNRFVSSNRNPLMHVVVAPGLLGNNAHYPFTDTVENVVPVAAKVYPLSPDTTAASYIPKLLSRQHSGTYTSASGICIRGNSAFICEPAQNLVQRQVLTSSGATFTATHPSPGKDFLATPDQWFRPVHAIVGPDGALYLCDMVRQYIDHPRYLPEDVRAKLPFKAGTEHGRIWRIKLNTPAPPKPTAAQKAAASQNLSIRQGKFPKTPGKTLLKQAQSDDANVRFLALLQLVNQSRADKLDIMMRAMADSGMDRWTEAAAFGAIKDEAKVAYQRLKAGLSPKLSPRAIQSIGKAGFEKAATLKSDKTIQMFDPKNDAWSLQISHFALGVAEGIRTVPNIEERRALISKAEIFRVTNILAARHGWDELSEAERIAIIKLVGSLGAASTSPPPENFFDALSPSYIFPQIEGIKSEFFDYPKNEAEKTEFTHQLAQSINSRQGLSPGIERYTFAQQLSKLRTYPSLMKTILHPILWESSRPNTREIIIALCVNRPGYHLALMEALEQGTVVMHSISPARRKALERSKAVGTRAKKVFAQHVGGDRMKAFEAAKPILKLKGNAGNGTKVFTRTCAICHRHGTQGHNVGPDLTGLRNQPAEALLLHIIVPNQEVYPQYTLYEVDTKDGQTFAGLLEAETSAQISLKLPLGITKSIDRKTIKFLRASPKSLMPDLLEKTMSQQELADLLVFLKK